VIVAAGGLDLDDAVADLEQRDVERASTEVEHEDRLVVGLVESVRKGCCGGLVDDPADVESGDFAGFLGRLALVVVEIGRHGDDRVGDRLTEVCLGVPLQLLQNERGDLLRVERLAVDVDGPVGAHMAFDRADRTVDVGHALALRDFTGEDLAVFGECHD